ncbi:MAG: hypothetical protein Q8M11_21895 [Sulfuritalea sp.]|nr:hypothetical protein [Sulfuritalea sp.]MDP1984873.1 hypothetical protein [Sulfuritalea sp.]
MARQVAVVRKQLAAGGSEHEPGSARLIVAIAVSPSPTFNDYAESIRAWPLFLAFSRNLRNEVGFLRCDGINLKHLWEVVTIGVDLDEVERPFE